MKCYVFNVKYVTYYESLLLFFCVSCCTITAIANSLNSNISYSDDQTKCGLRKTCNQCVPIGESDSYCLWSMSSSTCIHSLSVYKPENLSKSRKYAGIISEFSRCSVEIADYKYL